MIRNWIALILLCAALHAVAAVEESRREIATTDKRFVAVITHFADMRFPRFTIQDKSGEVLFSSETDAALRETFVFYPDGALWSPDGEVLAIACGYDKHKETYIFVHRGDSFQRLPLPDLTDQADNPWILPVKWLSGRRLLLALSWPHAGHPDTYFNGRATIRLSPQSLRCETLYKHITHTTYEE
jgi:hypothetical protein